MTQVTQPTPTYATDCVEIRLSTIVKAMASALRSRSAKAFDEYLYAYAYRSSAELESYREAKAPVKEWLLGMRNKSHTENINLLMDVVDKIHNVKVRKALKSLLRKRKSPASAFEVITEKEAYLWSYILETYSDNNPYSMLDIINKVFLSKSVKEGMQELKTEGVPGVVAMVKELETGSKVKRITRRELSDLLNSISGRKECQECGENSKDALKVTSPSSSDTNPSEATQSNAGKEDFLRTNTSGSSDSAAPAVSIVASVQEEVQQSPVTANTKPDTV